MIEYLPNFSGQLLGLLYSVGIGFALGTVYEVLRIIFFIFSGSDKKYIAARDTVFLLLCFTVTFFFFIIKYNGKVTFYAVLGEGIGGIAAFKSFDGVVTLFIKRVLRRTVIKLGAIFRRIRRIKCNFVKKIQSIEKNKIFSEKI